jgi:hypothetical protein
VMRPGVVSDLHGNRVVVEAVVAHGRAQGIAAWWGTGHGTTGPEPVATLERLASLPGLVATRGNPERYVLNGRPVPVSLARCRTSPPN